MSVHTLPHRRVADLPLRAEGTTKRDAWPAVYAIAALSDYIKSRMIFSSASFDGRVRSIGSVASGSSPMLSICDEALLLRAQVDQAGEHLAGFGGAVEALQGLHGFAGVVVLFELLEHDARAVVHRHFPHLARLVVDGRSRRTRGRSRSGAAAPGALSNRCSPWSTLRGC